jgi:hypothetical protein
MDLPPLALSLDSLIVAAGLSAVIAPRHIVPLAILFGVFDGMGSLAGVLFPVGTSSLGLLAPVCLILWGATVFLNLPMLARIGRSSAWAYALPPLLGLDNLLVPNTDWLAAGAGSAAMAVAGFALGFACFSAVASAFRGSRWIGGLLSLAGLLLAA